MDLWTISQQEVFPYRNPIMHHQSKVIKILLAEIGSFYVPFKLNIHNLWRSWKEKKKTPNKKEESF